MIVRKTLVLISFISLLSSFLYREPDCYGDFNRAWNTAQAGYSSDVARCSYAFAQGTCMREANLSLNHNINAATIVWERCIDSLL